jgi:hypothetical protein
VAGSFTFHQTAGQTGFGIKAACILPVVTLFRAYSFAAFGAGDRRGAGSVLPFVLTTAGSQQTNDTYDQKCT